MDFKQKTSMRPGLKSFMRMSGGKKKDPLSDIRKINCASLPPWTTNTLQNHLKRAHYVAKMWKRADQAHPTSRINPANYGWQLTENCFQPDWFSGSSVPESLTAPLSENTDSSTDEEESDSFWSEESEDSDEEEM